MKNVFPIKKLLLGITIFFFCVNVAEVRAEESDLIIDRKEWHADDYIVTGEEKYSFPSKLMLIVLDVKDTDSDIQDNMKELYYYFATRSGFGDFPFHYLVTEDGDVYSGNQYGDESKISIGDTSETILIAYIQNKNNGLSITGIEPLKDIILEKINKYAIDPGSIEVKQLTYKFGERVKLEDVDLVDASLGWQEGLESIKQFLASSYSPAEVSFSVELTEVTLPQEPQDPTSTAEIKLEVKNIGNFNIYSSLGSNIFVTRTDDERSSFYIEDEWASFSRVPLLSEGDRLAIDETKVFAFNVYVPLFPPEKVEGFVLVDSRENIIGGTEFEVSIQINKIEETIIEITDTPVGYLNVRSRPGLGDIVTKVSPGERYIAQEYESGYYKISANGQEGWVVNTYVKVIQ